LQIAEDYYDQAEPKETAPYPRVAPWVDTSTPLKGEKKAHDGTYEIESSQEVDLTNFLFGGELAMFSIGVLEEEKDNGYGNASERQVDPELFDGQHAA
jgi:hypothetical protein